MIYHSVFNQSVIFSNRLIENILGDVKSLSPEKSPIAMKDTKWYTHNSTVGFLVAGTQNIFVYTQMKENYC